MSFFRLFLVTLIFLCLSHATLAVIKGTFTTTRLISNKGLVFVELKHGSNYVASVCGNLIHRSFILTTYTPFRIPQYRDYHSYVRIGSRKSFEGGTVKRTDGHWPMKAVPEVQEDMFVVLVRLNSPYIAPGDVDFAFVAYTYCRPRGLNALDHTNAEYVVYGFRNPNGAMQGHVLSYASVKDCLDDNFCKSYYYIDNFFNTNQNRTVNCYTAFSCNGACYNGIYTTQNDDGGGMYFRKSNILVGIAQTEVRIRDPAKLVSLIGFVENTWATMIQNMWRNQKDEFDGYLEYPAGTGLFD